MKTASRIVMILVVAAFSLGLSGCTGATVGVGVGVGGYGYPYPYGGYGGWGGWGPRPYGGGVVITGRPF